MCAESVSTFRRRIWKLWTYNGWQWDVVGAMDGEEKTKTPANSIVSKMAKKDKPKEPFWLG